MAKISPKDPGTFELIDKGDYIFRGKRAKVEPPKTADQGWIYQVWFEIESGEFTGVPHYESYFTRSHFGDGLDGCRHVLGMLNAMGRIPDAKAQEFDSDLFETQGFADRFEGMVVDALVGGTVAYRTDKKVDPPRERARISKYFPAKGKPVPSSAEKKPVTKSDKEFDFSK